MKQFLLSDAGLATGGLFLTSLLIVWPPSVNFLAASLTLAFTLTKFQAAFRRLEAMEAAGSAVVLRSNAAPELNVADLLAASGESRQPAVR